MSSLYDQLHELFHAGRRLHFPFHGEANQIPRQGLYIMFERGEKYKEWDRIVRVGTHTGTGKLLSRLNEHYSKENKDRSIFRKHIGRCLLQQTEDTYLNIWNLDLTTRANRVHYGHLVDPERQLALEKQVSQYIQENLSFTVIEVPEQAHRRFWESRIISLM